jgi:hypothetical protein
MNCERKLQIQLGKSLARGYVTNAKLDAVADEGLQRYLRADERLVAIVHSRSGFRYCFTSHRAVQQSDKETVELFRYEDVRAAHWMFKDALRRIADSKEPQTYAPQLKSDHYDRIVVETGSSEVVLEGLEQAYVPILRFLHWIAQESPRS